MAALRKYSDLTDDAKRIYDGADRKIKKIEAKVKALTSISRSFTKYDYATRNKAGEKIGRLNDAKWKLKLLCDEILGVPNRWCDLGGIPVRVRGEVRLYRITNSKVGCGLGRGEVDLAEWPANTNALFAILDSIERQSHETAEQARKRVERRDEGLKAKIDPIAHWKEPGLP